VKECSKSVEKARREEGKGESGMACECREVRASEEEERERRRGEEQISSIGSRMIMDLKNCKIEMTESSG